MIQVVDPAIPPDLRSSPKRTLIVLGATALRLIMAVAIALLQATFDGMKGDLETSKKLSLFRKKLSFRNVST